jgi:transcriptional regulator
MYLPSHFEETRPEELHGLIAAHPLGALVVKGPHGLDANHIPFELDLSGGAPGVLLAHVARANPVWQEIREGDDALVIFRAAHAYVSPNWYPSKHEAHRQVPTYNYQVVHVHGKLRVRDDERFVRGVVAKLTRANEARAGGPPWKMTDAPPDFIEDMLTKIVGIEVAITRMVGKWKLSQNKEERDRVGVVQELRTRGDEAMASAIEATLESDGGGR